jgi:hypothetical protein
MTTYNEYPEILNTKQAAALCGVSIITFRDWLVNELTPFGPIKEDEHYFKAGPNYRFVKRQLGLLFKMIGE